MQFTYNHIDLSQAGSDPHDIIDREPGEVWYVPFTPLGFDKPATWRFYKQQYKVSIPLHAYLTSDEPTSALGFAIQLGVNVMGQLGQKPIKRLHLSLGNPIMSVLGPTGAPSWSFWCGFGVLFK